MINWIQEAQSNNPLLGLLAMLIVGSGLGTGGASLYSNKAYATEKYVDAQVQTISKSISDLRLELEYDSANQSMRGVTKEIFELVTLKKTKPTEFSRFHADRLRELGLQKDELTRDLNRLSPLIK